MCAPSDASKSKFDRVTWAREWQRRRSKYAESGCRSCGKPRVVLNRNLSQFCADPACRGGWRARKLREQRAAATAVRLESRPPCRICASPLSPDDKHWKRAVCRSAACRAEAQRRRKCTGVFRDCATCGVRFEVKSNARTGTYCTNACRARGTGARLAAAGRVKAASGEVARALAEAACPGAPVQMGRQGVHDWCFYVPRTRPCAVCSKPVAGTGFRLCSDSCREESTKRRRRSERGRDARKRAKWRRHMSGIPKGEAWKTRSREIYERDNWTCWLCREPVEPYAGQFSPRMATVDHVIPRSKGGHPTDPANLRTAHHACNSRKRDLLMDVV